MHQTLGFGLHGPDDLPWVAAAAKWLKGQQSLEAVKLVTSNDGPKIAQQLEKSMPYYPDTEFMVKENGNQVTMQELHTMTVDMPPEPEWPSSDEEEEEAEEDEEPGWGEPDWRAVPYYDHWA